MFPREKRLSRDDFGGAHTGRRLSSTNFSVVLPHHNEGYAVVISKKIAKLSVARHLLKRRILAVMRGLKLPKSLVIFPKTSATKLTFAEIQQELRELAAKISG